MDRRDRRDLAYGGDTTPWAEAAEAAAGAYGWPDDGLVEALGHLVRLCGQQECENDPESLPQTEDPCP